MLTALRLRRPADLPLRFKGLAIIALPLLVLVVSVALSVRVTDQENAYQASTRTALSTSTDVGQTLVSLLNAETGVRGYVATGDPSFLQPWQWAQAKLGLQLRSLASSPAVTAAQRRALARPAATEMALLRSLMRAPRGAGTLVSLRLRRLLVKGKAVMDQLRRTVSVVQGGVQRFLSQRREKVRGLRSTALAIAVAGLSVGLIGVLILYLFMSRIVQRVEAARVNAHRLGIGESLIEVPVSGDEIGRLSAELTHASGLLASRGADLVRAHRAALSTAREKDRFLSELAHEMRTPLTAIAGFGQLLDASDALTSEDAESATLIVRAANHLITLTDEIDASAEGEETLALNREPTRVIDVGEEVCALMGSIAAEKHVSLRLEVDPAVMVWADPQRLSQVLINLVSNAVKYNRVGGEVRIGARPGVTDRVRVFVSDTGIGIRAEVQPRVFAPHDRLDAEAGPVPGTGIGLALSRTYVEAMGGSIGLDSTEGQGSTFWVELPGSEAVVAV